MHIREIITTIKIMNISTHTPTRGYVSWHPSPTPSSLSPNQESVCISFSFLKSFLCNQLVEYIQWNHNVRSFLFLSFLSLLLIFLKKQLGFIDFFILFFYFIDFHFDFYDFLSSACFGFHLLFFCLLKVEKVTDLRILFSNIDIFVTNFPLITASVSSHKFWYVTILFSFNPKYFLIYLLLSSLTHLLLEIYFLANIWRISRNIWFWFLM